jgi:hypothetical protein
VGLVNPGDVAQDVDPAEIADAGLDGGLGIRKLGDIAILRYGLYAELLALINYLIRWGLVAAAAILCAADIANHNIGAFLSEPYGYRPANSPAGTGHYSVSSL